MRCAVCRQRLRAFSGVIVCISLADFIILHLKLTSFQMKITFLLLCAALCGGVAGAHSHELSTEDDTAADSIVQVVTKD